MQWLDTYSEEGFRVCKERDRQAHGPFPFLGSLGLGVLPLNDQERRQRASERWTWQRGKVGLERPPHTYMQTH